MNTRTVRTGLDVLLSEGIHELRNQRVGIVTNPTGVTRDLRSNVDALRAAGVNLVALFGPEHGFGASVADGAAVESGREARTGLPVYSLYGRIRKPTRGMLAAVDVLLFDLQDVGVRFYTYATTLALTLEACAEQRKRVVVLDRPNPINGVTIEGSLLDSALQSFIGRGRLPIRHGMTMGELAQFHNDHLPITCDLRIIAMEGWRREMWYDETGLQWISPSPGIPHFQTTISYPGTCFVEGTNLSEGRGTALPFEVVGAPWLDGHTLAEELDAWKIDGVRFRPVTFTPADSKHKGQVCYGVQAHVVDRDGYRAVTTGLHILDAARRQSRERFEFLAASWEGKPPHLDLLSGDARIREGLRAGASVEALVEAWQDGLTEFARTRRRYLLY